MRKSIVLREKDKTIYQRLAEKHGVSVSYIAKIARGERMPTKKKGMEIAKEIEQLKLQ